MNKKVGFFYGIVLTLVGIGLFYRIPELMLKVEKIDFLKQSPFLVRSSFYILGCFLILAGCIRIYRNYK